jgi:hypothetical protein
VKAGLTKQDLYNVVDRRHEDVLEYCERHNIVNRDDDAAGTLSRSDAALDSGTASQSPPGLPKLI